MIKTATQLKAKIRNLSQRDSIKAQMLIRNYFMERFLERISLSQFSDRFILKGGMLVAAMVGLDCRATMDIDTTVKSIDLSMDSAERVINEIISIDAGDAVVFSVVKMSNIMEEHDYPGIRILLEGRLEKMKQPIKIDISTNDVITPEAIRFSYNLMFEERTIALLSYNVETLLAEKIETIMARDVANTRMRDFFDIHALLLQEQIDFDILKTAFIETSRKRDTADLIPHLTESIQRIEKDPTMKSQWENYAESSFYVGDLIWEDVIESIRNISAKLN